MLNNAARDPQNRRVIDSTKPKVSWQSRARELPDGASPKEQIPRELPNKPSYILNSRDIEGNRSVPKDWATREKARRTNPLDPQYAWFEQSPAAEPDGKFVRDQISKDDIEGASPRRISKPESLSHTRNFDVNDIASYKNWATVRLSGARRTGRDPLDVRDITGERVDWQRPDTKATHDLDFARPKKLSREVTPCDFRLRVDDIPGAKPNEGAVWRDPLGKKERREHRTPCSATTEGVEGGQVPEMRPAEARRARREAAGQREKPSREETDKVVEQLLDSKAGRKLWKAFDKLDRDNSGKLTRGELNQALNQCGIDVSEKDVSNLLAAFDQDASGHFSRTAFAKEAISRRQYKKCGDEEQREHEKFNIAQQRETERLRRRRRTLEKPSEDEPETSPTQKPGKKAASSWRATTAGNVAISKERPTRREKKAVTSRGEERAAFHALRGETTEDGGASWRPSHDAPINAGLAMLAALEASSPRSRSAQEQSNAISQPSLEKAAEMFSLSAPNSAKREGKTSRGKRPSHAKQEDISLVRSLE